MAKLLKIDNIMFYVKDLEKAAKFYEENFGLIRAWSDDENKMIGFVFEQSDSEIVIHSNPEIPNPDFSFLVENVEDFCKTYEASGGRVVENPLDVRCGKFAILSDQDGNKIPVIDLTKFGGKAKYN
ncbi:MAG: VOC family protein [Candidatus Pacebacteria bacterium]|nr:VOC family protein [Candidatus Paceibacterota bacterium]